jgi:uncharacterized protein (TIGR02466 family)
MIPISTHPPIPELAQAQTNTAQDPLKRHSLWATDIFQTQINHRVVDLALELALPLVPEKPSWSPQGPWRSTDLLHLEDQWMPVRRAIEDELTLVARAQGLKQNLKLQGLWLNVQTADCQYPPHGHPNSYLSGQIYLQCNQFSSRVQFWDPRAQAQTWLMHRTDESVQPGIQGWNPWPGLCLMFPSWLQHGTVASGPIDDGQLRLSLAFNAVPQGTVSVSGARITVL